MELELGGQLQDGRRGRLHGGPRQMLSRDCGLPPSPIGRLTRPKCAGPSNDAVRSCIVLLRALHCSLSVCEVQSATYNDVECVEQTCGEVADPQMAIAAWTVSVRR